MSLRHLLAQSLLGMAAASSALPGHAALVAQESFDYAAGSSLVGQNGGLGFQSAWAAGGFNASLASNFTLGANPLSAGSGSHVTTDAVNAISGVTRNLAMPLAGVGATYYMSFLIRPEDTLGGGAFAGFFGLVVGNSPGYANEMFFGKPGGGALGQYALEDRGGLQQVTTGAATVVQDTSLLVVKMVFGTVGSTVFSLYVDPDTELLEPASAFSATRNNVALTSVSYLSLYSSGAFALDEIRVGTTYADVVTRRAVPEPSTAWIAALGLLAVAGASSQRRRA